MSHFAQINESNQVVQVIVAEQDFIDTGLVGSPSNWIQTSYNTFANTHRLGGTPLRKNYAGIGYSYDSVRDAFIPPQPFPSWTLVEETCNWEAPVTYPTDGNMYMWDEATTTWIVSSYAPIDTSDVVDVTDTSVVVDVTDTSVVVDEPPAGQ